MSYRQPKEFNDFVRSLYVPQSEQDFLQTIADGILKIIPGENVMAAIFDLKNNRTSYCADALPLAHADTAERFATFFPEHPLCYAAQRPAYQGHYVLSDVVGQRQWHRMEVYNEIYRREYLEDEWSIQIGNTNATMSCISVLREKWGFTDRERHSIELLVPHLQQAGENSRRFNSSIPAALVAQAEGDLREGMILLDDKRRIVACSERTRQVVGSFFTIQKPRFENLPDELEAWLSQARPLPFKKILGQNVLEIHAYWDKSSRRHLLTVRPSGLSFAAIALRSLGLSPRQTEVLYWLALGKRTEEIAVIMNLSFFTVKNHIGNILGIMGVETRTAAAAIVLRLL